MPVINTKMKTNLFSDVNNFILQLLYLHFSLTSDVGTNICLTMTWFKYIEDFLHPAFFFRAEGLCNQPELRNSITYCLSVLCSATPTVEGDHLARVTRRSQVALYITLHYITCSAVDFARGS